MTRSRLDMIGVLAASAHAVLAFAIFGQHFEGSWGGFLMFAIDFPASVLFFLPGVNGSWPAMIAIGSIWWYLVVVGLRRFVKYVARKGR